MGLVVNSETMQQPTILVTFFQITEIIVRTRHKDIGIESKFLLYLPVLFLFLLLLIAS